MKQFSQRNPSLVEIWGNFFYYVGWIVVRLLCILNSTLGGNNLGAVTHSSHLKLIAYIIS